MEVLNNAFPQIKHLLCQWHISQNLKKLFSFLSNVNMKTVYDKVLSLIKINDPKKFDDLCEEIQKALKSKKYTKSYQYFERICSIKEKWASCLVPKMFTVGIHTTSRIESVNAVIKKYVNSTSEISDILDFIIAFENKQKLSLGEIDPNDKKANPLLDEMKSKLSTYIFDLHEEQFQLCFRYMVDQESLSVLNMQSEAASFKVSSIDAKDVSKFRIVRFSNKEYHYEYETFIYSIICRHIFYVSSLRQEKQLSCVKIHPRWTVEYNNECASLTELFQTYVKENKSEGNENGDEEEKEVENEKDEDDKVGGKENIDSTKGNIFSY